MSYPGVIQSTDVCPRKINDDGFWHTLIVYKDTMTGGVRLLAAVWEGVLLKCPIWTAFGSHPFITIPSPPFP